MMSSYNGEKFIEEQINSILSQTIDVTLLIRDDGSTDGTIEILKKYTKLENVFVDFSENVGPIDSFLESVYNAKLDFDFYFFADQDDVWFSNKIEVAVRNLQESNNNGKIPKLYYSNVEMTDTNLRKLEKQLNYKEFSIFDIILGDAPLGCTICYNKELQELLLRYYPQMARMHDHWITLVCLAVNGQVFFDSQKTMYYRQHGNNVVGGNKSVKMYLISLMKQFKNKDNIRINQLRELEKGYRQYIDIELNKKIQLLLNYQKNLISKLKCLFDHSIYSKSVKRNILFRLSILLNRF